MPRKTALGPVRGFQTRRGSGLRNRNRAGIHSYARKVKNGHRTERYDRPAVDYTAAQWAEIVRRSAVEAGISRPREGHQSTQVARFERRNAARKAERLENA